MAIIVAGGLLAGVAVFRLRSADAEAARAARVEPVRQQTSAALAAITPDFDARQSSTDAALVQLYGKPTYRARAVTCHLTGVGVLRAESYVQDCSLRVVELYPVDGGIVEVAAELERSRAPVTAIGTQVPDIPADGGCGQFRYNYPPGDVETLRLGFLATRRLGLPGERPSPSDRCQAPDPVDRSGDYAFSADPTFDPAAVPLNRNWLVVDRQHIFFEADLGCEGQWWCGKPVPGPVLP